MCRVGFPRVRNGKGGEIAIDGLDDGDDQGSSLDLQEVVPAVGPDHEVSAMGCRTSGESSEDQNGGVECVELVVESSPIFQDGALNFLAGKDQLQDDEKAVVATDPAEDVEIEQTCQSSAG